MTAGDILDAVALSILAEIWSGSLYFVWSMLQMRSNTSSTVQSNSTGQFSPPRVENPFLLIGDSGIEKFFANDSFSN